MTTSAQPADSAAASSPAETLPSTALLVVDMQHDVACNGHQVDRVIANIASLVDRARAGGHPVVWIQHDDDDLPKGSDGWQFIAGLSPDPDELVIAKNFGDSFEATGLRQLLVDLGVGTVIVTGAQTEWCIRSTLHGALVRGFNTTLISDAHTTDDLSDQGATLTADQTIRFTNGYWQHTAAPGRTCRVIATADLDL